MNKKWLYGLGMPVVFGSYFLTLYLFIQAYLNPLKMHGIKIDLFGEANVELIFLLVSVPIVVFLFCDMAKNVVPNMEKKRYE